MRKVRVRHPAIGDFAFTVTGKGVVVGRRGGGADIDLGWDSRVSRRHGRFWTEDGQVLFEDLSSRNGSFIGPKRVSEARLLVGDSIILGDTTFSVEEGREDDAPELTAQIAMPLTPTIPPPTVSTVKAVNDLAMDLTQEGDTQAIPIPEPIRAGEVTKPPIKVLPKPETPRGEAKAPEAQKPEPAKPTEAQKPDSQKPLSQKPDSQKPDLQKPDSQKPDSQKPQKPVSTATAPAAKPKGEATAPRRFIGSTQVKLEVREKKALTRVWETELSKNRLFVPTESPPAPGTSVLIFVETPDGDLTLRAQVAQVLDAAKAKAIGTRPGVGLQIQDLSGGKKDQLVDYLEGRRATLT
ncbi:MAG: FHA domain-containing protein [Deltaproteobacteria bacterium]|nr:FHA domain-containing protein [Deltaproteobacteria bacterium]